MKPFFFIRSVDAMKNLFFVRVLTMRILSFFFFFFDILRYKNLRQQLAQCQRVQKFLMWSYDLWEYPSRTGPYLHLPRIW